MDMDTAINNILRNYGEMAAVDYKQLEKMFYNGLKCGLSVKQMYDGMRLVYGVVFGQPEIFSMKEASEMLELSESGLLEELQAQGIEPGRVRGSIYYFPDGL